jgi:hypothetical protein
MDVKHISQTDKKNIRRQTKKLFANRQKNYFQSKKLFANPPKKIQRPKKLFTEHKLIKTHGGK